MRSLILAIMLSLTYAAPAADEVFTLADGRTFVGEYDAEAGQLHTRIGAKDVAIAVTPEQITERAAFDPKKAPKVTPATPAKTVVAKPKADPNAMKPEEKAAAEHAFARATKMREAAELEASALKLERDSKSAMDDAKRSRDQAHRNAEKFEKRALEEGLSVSEPAVFENLIMLKRTNANNQATLDAWKKAEAAEAKAADCAAQAQAKHVQAAQVRAYAEAMPTGD